MTTLSKCNCGGVPTFMCDDFLTWVVCTECGRSTGRFQFTEEAHTAWQRKALVAVLSSPAPAMTRYWINVYSKHGRRHRGLPTQDQALSHWLRTRMEAQGYDVVAVEHPTEAEFTDEDRENLKRTEGYDA